MPWTPSLFRLICIIIIKHT